MRWRRGDDSCGCVRGRRRRIMGGNTGVRRDVLRWLVALNLSFPIKNIKRDFSNGFLVAEIFSRYFPHDIQMHSYDYGTRLEKKRDNWAQLQKFFKKRSFVVMKDEVETIISCATPDGAGPLLERMYKFLTQKRCKPEEAAAVQQWRGGPEPASELPPAPPSERADACQQAAPPPQGIAGAVGGAVYVNESSNLTSSTFSAMNTVVAERALTCACMQQQGASISQPCYNPSCQHFISVSNSFFSIQREAVNQSAVREHGGLGLPQESEGNVIGAHGGYHQFKDDSDDSPPQTPTKVDTRERNPGKASLSAVERARQRETSETKSRPKAKRTEPSGAKSGSEPASDVALAFRSPHRQRVFKQYTLNDYRRQQTGMYVQLGKLGPDLEDGDLGEKREKLERMKEFGRIVRTCNTTHVTAPKKTKTPPLSKRQKALEFAATVPKPKRKEPAEGEKPHTPEKERNHHTLTELQLLEAKHEADKQHVEAMRRELELFLR